VQDSFDKCVIANAKAVRSRELTSRNDGEKCTTALQELVTIRAAHGPEDLVSVASEVMHIG